jgi:hypothetical protein
MAGNQKTRIPAVPIRTPLTDENGNLTRPWMVFFERLWPQPGSGDVPGAGSAKGPAAIGWDVQDSTPGTDISDPVIVPSPMRIAACKVRIKTSDASNAFEFDIKLGGVSIFTSHPIVAAGTSTRTVQDFTSLLSTVDLATDDDLTLDIVSGGNWQVAIYLPAGPGDGITSALTTKGDIWVYSTTDDRLPVGVDGQVLSADSTQGTGLKWVNGGGTGTVTHTTGALTADLPMFGAGAADAKVGTKSGTTNQVATVSGSLTAGHFLTVDSSGNVVDGGSAPGSGGGSGTVTSVGLSMPSEFSVSGTPVTTSGTLAVSKANQSASTVFAGPTSGSAAPTFRALVAADIPAIAESGVTGLVSDLAAKAPLASPTFTGTPAAPTATAGTNTTQLATTAFVQAAVAAGGGGGTSSAAGVIGIVIDGGSASPTTGSKGFVQSPYNGTITGWTLIGDASGSAQITVKKSTYSAFPTTSSIVASAPPALSSAQKNTSTTLTGWTTTVATGDIFEFNLDSVTTCKRLILELNITKS